MAVDVRRIDPSELKPFSEAITTGFLGDSSEGHVRVFEATEDLSRAIAGFDDGEVVATLGAFNLELAIPGGSLATAGTTQITVRPTHRRQGLLRELMRQHFEEIRERGEMLAALWASESGIYARFGYGSATDLLQISVDSQYGAFRKDYESPGRCRIVDAERASVLVPEIYEGLWRRHPGCFARPRVWWDNRQLLDHPLQREGLSANRFAVYEEAGEAQGYAQYRVREHWNASGIPQGELRMVEMQGTPNARAALWRLLLDVDLVGRVSYWGDAVDSSLPWLLADPRRAERRMRDALWVRLMDVPRALEARSYAGEDRVVIGVQDETCPDNQANWQLDGAPGGAKCQRSSRAPDFELDVSDLGSVYLGAHSLFELSCAGRVRGDRDAIVRADRMLRTPSAPWCPEIF